jgi:hypothetical protein
MGNYSRDHYIIPEKYKGQTFYIDYKVSPWFGMNLRYNGLSLEFSYA